MTGLAMFALALTLMLATGLPVYAVLLATATLFSAGGVAVGAFDAALLGALPNRIVGLLEHDLLQALPLYALIGALLNRLPLAAGMHLGATWLLRRQPAAPELGALGVAALLAPMNGSVGASLHMLSRSVAPRLDHSQSTPARATATLCVASALGVAIPPSLVLLLLGDAMMRAHTEALNATHAATRIVNSQDVMRAALVPAALVLLLALAVSAWRARGAQCPAAPRPQRRDAWATGIAAAVIALLLAAVAAGRLYAVEAAASGALLLVTYAALTGQLGRKVLRDVLRDAMALTGLLFALLVAATSFSLVLRGFGTDVLIADGLRSLSGRPSLLLLAVLGGLALCTFVLDAFEMIFLVIPIVMPPLLQTVPDAAWVAALTLLVLQLGFLLPPCGYAVVMSRMLSAHPPRLRTLSRELLPFLAVQVLLVALVFTFPQVTQWTRPTEATLTPATTIDNATLERLFDEAVRAQQEPASAAR